MTRKLWSNTQPDRLDARVGLEICRFHPAEHVRSHDALGRLDVLVITPPWDPPLSPCYLEDAFEQDSLMLNIDADGALKMCQVFLKETAHQANSRNLKIINISSVGDGLQGFPDFRI